MSDRHASAFRPSVGGTLDAMAAELAAVPGTVSVWCARLDRPAYQLNAQATHYAASTMKVAVLAALYRAAEAGRLDLTRPIPVRNRFTTALGTVEYQNEPSYDNDDQVWSRLDGEAPLGWLAERMIVRSSNLATNLVLAQVGLPAVAEVWSLVGARHSTTQRGIEDAPAREAGLTNLVTAEDLGLLFTAIATGTIASAGSCRAMVDILLAQEYGDDLAAGLPPGTRVAHKNGWISGVRHGAGIVYPSDAPPYVLAVCTSTPLPDDDACRLVARVSAAAWASRADAG